MVLSNFGLDPGRTQVSIECSRAAACSPALTPRGGRFTFHIHFLRSILFVSTKRTMAKSKVKKAVSKSGAALPPDRPGESPPGLSLAQIAVPPASMDASHQSQTAIPGEVNVEVAEKIKELVRLAQDQGHLTYGDINDALPDTLLTPETLDDIYVKLRSLEIEIVGQAEVDRVKQPQPEEEDDKTRPDMLYDPVRLHLKQMGQVPSLTREQEVEVCTRIEEADHDVRRISYDLGFPTQNSA